MIQIKNKNKHTKKNYKVKMDLIKDLNMGKVCNPLIAQSGSHSPKSNPSSYMKMEVNPPN